MRLAPLGSNLRAVLVLMALGAAIAGCTVPEITFDDMDMDLCSGKTEAVTSIRLQPSEANLRVGFTVQVEVTPLDAQGQLVFCAPVMKLESTVPAVATVSGARVVTGLSAGKTFIRVTFGAKTDSVAVTVVATSIATVSIQAPASLLVGQTAQLRLVARDTDGNVITPQSIAWQSDGTTVGTVSSTGMLVAVDEGSIRVTAMAEGLTAVAQVPVTRDAPARRFRQIAAGFQHTCAIVGGGGVPEGTAFCWGDGLYGQLGIGQIGRAAEPFPVSGGHVFASITASGNSSCALTIAGEAYCWGKNDSGQLGDGTTVDRTVPVRVVTPLTFRSLALGGAFACGLTSDGAAHCWGRPNNVVVRVPPTPLPGGIQFAELTGGSGFMCGRTSGGRAYCWGAAPAYTWAGAAPTAVKGDQLFSQISAGDYHVCGVAITDGLGYCWGRLDARPLGSSVPAGSRDTPVAIPGALRYTTVAAGRGFTCGVTDSGSFCVGLTDLSNSVTTSSQVPIPAEDRHRFATISGGSMHGCAIDTNGGGWCWGRNFEGQVGAGEYETVATEPRQLRIR